MSKRPEWLDNAVFYEVYPQSFKDTDGDGIGNISGITQKLPYIRDLGCTALWINPCFESPLVYSSMHPDLSVILLIIAEISADFNTLPTDTTFSFTTSAGIDIAPYSMIFCRSVMYSTSIPIPSTAFRVLS